MDLAELQRQHREWLAHNFPGQAPHHGLLGVVEELGELAHAHLKAEQGIRGYDDEGKTAAEIRDAVGDIVIYLASYCNTNGIDLGACVREAWEQVSRRDWAAEPETG